MAAEQDADPFDELVDELSRVLWQLDEAKMLALQAGFPARDLPSASTVRVFWAHVVRAANAGKLIGGVRALAERAAHHYPGNLVIARHAAPPPAPVPVPPAPAMAGHYEVPPRETRDSVLTEYTKDALRDHLLVRQSLQWAHDNQKGHLPPVIKCKHLMMRDAFPSAEMAIVLLEDAPTLAFFGNRAELEVNLCDQSYGIYNNTGKRFLSEHYVPNDEVRTELALLGQELHRELLTQTAGRISLDGRGRYIPWRWASGGYVPVARWKDRWWCVLFWRDIAPVGWNVSNGASEDSEEYKNLDHLMWRELCEELVVVGRDPESGIGSGTIMTHRLVRSGDDTFPAELLAVHHDLRQESGWLLSAVRPAGPRREIVPIPGPHDVSIVYYEQDGNVARKTVRDVMVSINPLEFGIEVLRVAAIHLQDHDYLIDGETLWTAGDERTLIRRPVGLFSLEALYTAWARDGRLGAPVSSGTKHLEGRRVSQLTLDDIHLFDADIRARKRIMASRPSKPIRRWLNEFGADFDRLSQGTEFSAMLQVFCPVTWRTLEIGNRSAGDLWRPFGESASLGSWESTPRSSNATRSSLAFVGAA